MVRHSSLRRSRKKKSKSKFRGPLGKRVSPTNWDEKGLLTDYSRDSKRTRTDRTPSEYLAFIWPDVKEFYDTNKKSFPTQYEEKTWKDLVTHKGKSSMMTVTLKGTVDTRGNLSEADRFIFEIVMNGEEERWKWSHKYNWSGGHFETHYQLLCLFDLDARTI